MQFQRSKNNSIVHTATRWTIRHSLMRLWFADLMNITEEGTIHRPNVSRSVETLGLWIVTSLVTFIKSANQSSIKPCLIPSCPVSILVRIFGQWQMCLKLRELSKRKRTENELIKSHRADEFAVLIERENGLHCRPMGLYITSCGALFLARCKVKCKRW